MIYMSRFRVPSRLPLLFCYVGSSWIGQSVPIVQQVCTDHELTLPHLSLIPHLPYMSLCLLLVVSRLSCLCTYCHLPVYLSPSAADLNARWSSSSCGGQLWNLGVLSSNLNIVYVILCIVAKNKVFSFFHTLLLSPSAPSPDNTCWEFGLDWQRWLIIINQVTFWHPHWHAKLKWKCINSSKQVCWQCLYWRRWKQV